MKLLQLALTNIQGSAFRSWAVFICALLISGFALSTTLIVEGAYTSLQLANQRLGADIIVVPNGAQTGVETALLMGKPTDVWMDRRVADQVARVQGVAAVSPQLYLASLDNAACCSVSQMFIVAFDPQTDFTVTPWLTERLGRGLNIGEAVGGTYVFTPSGEEFIKLYGYLLTLKGNLEPTGTGLDRTLFLTFNTANDIARLSVSRAERPLDVPQDKISTVMVRVAPGADPVGTAVRIMQEVPSVTPIPSPNLFLNYRKQIESIIGIVGFVLFIALGSAILLIGVVFSMAVNERRREIGMLRALGARQGDIIVFLLSEANVLALAGGLAGTGIAAMGVYLFRNLIISSLSVPFLLPSLQTLGAWIVGGLLVALVSVSAAALVPIVRISRLDPAIAMRE